MQKLDLKFYGEIRKVKNDTVVPDDQWMCFLIKDDAFPATLEFYYRECERQGADEEQLAAVRKTINRTHAWREANPELCKTPDAKGEKLGD